MAGLVVPITGPYVGTWNSLTLGTQGDDGYVISAQTMGQEINASDAYGQTFVEGIYRGTNYRLRLRGLEFHKDGLLTLLQMFGMSGANTTLTPQLVNIGDKMTNYAKTLLLTAILGNPPTMPQTVTSMQAVLAPNQTSEFMMTSKMRELPIEMALIPYSTASGSSTINVPFTTT